MGNTVNMEIIARIRTDFPTKFGIPRQSSLVEGLRGRIVFEPPFRNPDAVRGLEGFSHIWLIWQFSEAVRQGWTATVRPPRLGGNTRMGVFATRSPFRPNAMGLSSLRLDGIDWDAEDGPVLLVSGVDMMDGTPIFDIKPYLPFTDSHPDAQGGFADGVRGKALEVDFPEELLSQIEEEARESLIDVLSQDPRPSYQKDDTRIYGMPFGNQDIRFTVADGVLRVCAIDKISEGKRSVTHG